jgi:hypothetical protein
MSMYVHLAGAFTVGRILFLLCVNKPIVDLWPVNMNIRDQKAGDPHTQNTICSETGLTILITLQ